jgi:S-adenosylmethionine:tRNA-ribosyltransferase-isomerase (queuine synthetase)
VIQALTALEVLGTRCSALRLRVTTALVVLLLLMAFHVPRDTLLMVGGAFQ